MRRGRINLAVAVTVFALIASPRFSPGADDPPLPGCVGAEPIYKSG